MNMGWVVLGASTALAVVGAVGLGIVSTPSEAIHGPTIGVCGSPNEPATAGSFQMAASFVVKNTSDDPVTVRGLEPTTVVGLRSAEVTMAKGAAKADASVYTVGAAVGVSASRVAQSSSVVFDRPTTIAPHAFATVITSMSLAPGAKTGRAGDYALTTDGPLGTLRTQTITASVGLGIDGPACSTGSY